MSNEVAPPSETPRTTAQDTPADLKAQSDKLVAEGKKAIALRQWEEGVAKYADALDLMRQLVGEFDPAMAPLLLSYGKALCELALSQQGIMGRDEVDKQTGDAPEASNEAGPSSNFVFSAEPVSDDEANGEPNAVEAPLEGAAPPEDAPEAEPAGAGGEGEEEVDEPEDDYNAAWEVLDVARTIYAKIVEGLKEGEGREERLCLAECYLALGDVSCETENFPQAVQDYSSALDIKSVLLPPSSRALASVHYQLATVLEFTPNRRSDALSHVESALTGFKARLAELSGSGPSEEVPTMGEKEKENERHDVQALLGDLEVKIEELKAAPPAEDLVSESINHLLGKGGSVFGGPSIQTMNGEADSGPVNDLTSMVKKKPKKVAVEANGNGNAAADPEMNGEKRKLEEGAEPTSKRARVEDA